MGYNVLAFKVASWSAVSRWYSPLPGPFRFTITGVSQRRRSIRGRTRDVAVAGGISAQLLYRPVGRVKDEIAEMAPAVPGSLLCPYADQH